MNIVELLTDLTTGTNAIIRTIASNLNLTASQAFHLLSIPFDGIPMSGLAFKLGLDNSTLTRNVQKLEKLNLVKRQTDSYELRNDPEFYEPFEDSLFFDQGQLIRIKSNMDCGAPFAEDYRQEEQVRLQTEFEKLKGRLKK